jgi:DnaK suppressor protein
MEQKKRDELKQLLEAEKVRLEKDLSGVTGGKDDPSLATVDAVFPQYGSKDDENAAEVATFSDSLSLEEKIEEALSDVNKALARFDEGTYGICKYCNDEIDIRRLEARPASSSCISCKEALKSS